MNNCFDYYSKTMEVLWVQQRNCFWWTRWNISFRLFKFNHKSLVELFYTLFRSKVWSTILRTVLCSLENCCKHYRTAEFLYLALVLDLHHKPSLRNSVNWRLLQRNLSNKSSSKLIAFNRCTRRWLFFLRNWNAK